MVILADDVAVGWDMNTDLTSPQLPITASLRVTVSSPTSYTWYDHHKQNIIQWCNFGAWEDWW